MAARIRVRAIGPEGRRRTAWLYEVPPSSTRDTVKTAACVQLCVKTGIPVAEWFVLLIEEFYTPDHNPGFRTYSI